MGSFFTNVHVRTEDTDGVAKLAEAYGRAYLSDCANGWTSLYPEKTEEQDINVLVAITADMSKRFGCAAIGMLCHDSDLFEYVVCENGKIADRYNSAPGYFDGGDFEPSGGDTDVLLRVTTSPEATREAIVETLHQDVTFVEDVISDFAHLLGIDSERAILGFTYAEQGEADFELRLLAPSAVGATSGRSNVVEMRRPESSPLAPPPPHPDVPAEYSPNVVPQAVALAKGILRMGWRTVGAQPETVERARQWLRKYADKIPVEQLDWSVFITKRLNKAGVTTLQQVTEQSRDSLIGMGKLMAAEFAEEVAVELGKLGMKLKA